MVLSPIPPLVLKEHAYRFQHSVERTPEGPQHEITVFDMSFLEGRISNGFLCGLATSDLILIRDWLTRVLKIEEAVEANSQFQLPSF